MSTPLKLKVNFSQFNESITVHSLFVKTMLVSYTMILVGGHECGTVLIASLASCTLGLLDICRAVVFPHFTMTCGADARVQMVARIVKRVNTIRQTLSSTMAANFQSPSMSEDSSSSRSLSVIT